METTKNKHFIRFRNLVFFANVMNFSHNFCTWLQLDSLLGTCETENMFVITFLL